MEIPTNEMILSEQASGSGSDFLEPQTKTLKSIHPSNVPPVSNCTIVCTHRILEYSDKDVLSGRGGATNRHPGNRHYRELILSHLQSYEDASKQEKPVIAKKLVQLIRDDGGRFLGQKKDGSFYDIGDSVAREKTSQALRHRAYEKRNQARKDNRTRISKIKDFLVSFPC